MFTSGLIDNDFIESGPWREIDLLNAFPGNYLAIILTISSILFFFFSPKNFRLLLLLSLPMLLLLKLLSLLKVSTPCSDINKVSKSIVIESIFIST